MGYLLLDLEGLTLTEEDKEIIIHPALFGVILFARNYEDPQQLKALTTAIHAVNPRLCIMVDQEGGRVQRFCKHFTQLPSMREWGGRYAKVKAQGLVDLKKMMFTMIQELQQTGVQVTLMPVLDVDYGVSEIIGERSFGRDVIVITELAEAIINVLHTYGMPAIGKHFPGHGAVQLDSHQSLPVDQRSLQEIWQADLFPYQKLIHSLDAIMPAHIIYPEVDDRPAGFSPIWLQQILRQRLEFSGLIISDDISMQAAACYGSYSDRANLAWEAGCDVVSVCNNRAGAIKILDAIQTDPPRIMRQKAQQFFNRISKSL